VEIRSIITQGMMIAPCLFGFAPGGVCRRHDRSPNRRCALTAPFHPYPINLTAIGAVSFLWHFPLSQRFQPTPLGITQHPISMEPGLSSSSLNDCQQPSSQPTPSWWRMGAGLSNAARKQPYPCAATSASRRINVLLAVATCMLVIMGDLATS